MREHPLDVGRAPIFGRSGRQIMFGVLTPTFEKYVESRVVDEAPLLEFADRLSVPLGETSAR